MSQKLASRLATVGAIANRLNVPLHNVEYIIRARAIEASSIAGAIRVFDEDAVRRIQHELKHKRQNKAESVNA